MGHYLYHVPMKKCAFLTLDERGDWVIDDEHAIEPLAELGWDVHTVSWRQRTVPWEAFEAVVIRSTWDYWNDVPAFLDVLQTIDKKTRLANPLSLVHWNLSKTYMQDLERKGVNIVPTLWPDTVEPGSFEAFSEALETEDLVIKPVVGANGDKAFRVNAGDRGERVQEICRVFRQREAMVQRFMPEVLTEGEYSLFYFSGEFSHAILKVPAANEFRSQEERGADILPAEPEALLLERGQQALGALGTPPLYARIDFVRDEKGDYALMEQELIEPSMYLRTDPGAAKRFAQAIDRWFAQEL